MAKQWFCGTYKERSNRPPWRWTGSEDLICPICMRIIGGTIQPQCGGRWIKI